MRKMKVSYSLLMVFACCFTHHITRGQTGNLTYQLQGVVDRDTGTVTLLPNGEGFDPNLTNNYQTILKHGRFLLTGKMAYPGSYRIRISPGYISSYFLIEPGKQTIVCHVDSLRETPQLTTKIMAEYTQFMADYVAPIGKQREEAFEQYMDQKLATTKPHVLDSLQTAYSQNRSRLIHQQQRGYLTYITQHPASYVPLWQLVRDMGEGYQPIFDSLYQAFSASLKATPTGRMIAQRLNSSKMTAVGQIFPSLSLVDMNNKPVFLTADRKSKYTLVDFWFSRCGPCLDQFPTLKELYARYQAKGFTIIGISIDKSPETEFWRKTIQANGLAWTQYLDPSGKLTVGLLSINYFPSNFLLDENGTIIRKDSSPQELSTFLSQRL
ncbi:TlpA disulfide reductase family protein [Spirosoma agri]|uniref:AhpC/TSA family protein n=1 Tax=Spirosoma agri TaxID=1987381 RepID=A0A6M0IPK0_9BACT|nr:TlpA disulfide reductase family protein [Spirosoma agri]NEU70300.1 AhpC/TSA family protein [Spirosoma agri]